MKEKTNRQRFNPVKAFANLANTICGSISRKPKIVAEDKAIKKSKTFTIGINYGRDNGVPYGRQRSDILSRDNDRGNFYKGPGNSSTFSHFQLAQMEAANQR